MLYINRPAEEHWDDQTNEFVKNGALSLVLEHSLISISKWESKWHKPFLDDKPKTDEEMIDYVRCMCLSQNTPDEVFENMPLDVMKQVNDYISDPMSATTFQDNRPNGTKMPKKKQEVITSELIYYWLIAYQIPFDCQKWHLTRLMNLVKICQIKAEEQDPKSKSRMSRKEILSKNAQLNAMRRKSLNTSG